MKEGDSKKSRKRKIPTTNENDTVPSKLTEQQSINRSTETNAALLKKLDDVFLVLHPQELLDFWFHAQKLDEKMPTHAFSTLESLKLVGPFEVLNSNDEGQLTKSRFSTDLPEMETIIVYESGRFCYWRDVPNELPNYIVHASHETENFPAFTIIGERSPFSVLQYLLTAKKYDGHKFRHLFPEKFDMDSYGNNYLQMLKKRRARESIGKPFHGMGIKVEVNEKDIGYRPVAEDIGRLKKQIEAMGTANDENTKKALKAKLLSLYSCVQFANDEMDFGMGLEFGHDLFVSNYECFDGMARSVLKTAYGLLERKEFATILEKHFESGRRLNDTRLE